MFWWAMNAARLAARDELADGAWTGDTEGGLEDSCWIKISGQMDVVSLHNTLQRSWGSC